MALFFSMRLVAKVTKIVLLFTSCPAPESASKPPDNKAMLLYSGSSESCVFCFIHFCVLLREKVISQFSPFVINLINLFKIGIILLNFSILFTGIHYLIVLLESSIIFVYKS